MHLEISDSGMCRAWWESGGELGEAPVFPFLARPLLLEAREMQMSITGKVTYSQRKYDACERCGHLKLVFTPILKES